MNVGDYVGYSEAALAKVVPSRRRKAELRRGTIEELGQFLSDGTEFVRVRWNDQCHVILTLPIEMVVKR